MTYKYFSVALILHYFDLRIDIKSSKDASYTEECQVVIKS